MFNSDVYVRRRKELCRRMGKGLILLPGNSESPMSYEANAFDFRQDSTFLYYFGLDVPSLAGVIDAESGETTLYGNDTTLDDLIWTGPTPSMQERAATSGVTDTKPLPHLDTRIAEAVKAGRKVHYLPPYRGETSLLLSRLLGTPATALFEGISTDLLFAVAEMREKKEACELEEMDLAFFIGYAMQTVAMKMCRAGMSENELIGTLDGIPKISGGWGVAFPSIITQHGETLHHLQGRDILEDGRLLLVDVGGERASHYCSDHTRTYPVNGRFTQRQKEIYNIVLEAHDRVPQILRPGMLYTELHRSAELVLAEGLRGTGLVKCSAEDAVEAGVISGLFMPHGLSHGMGLDVHDCQALGERSFDFSPFAERAAASGTCIHRKTWRLNEGTVMSDEPGIYFIPALIDKCRAEGRFKGLVDYDLLETYKDFGGIRIEDDIVVTSDGCRIVGGERHIPVTVEELEAVVGQD
ncbi:MAG: aminopeptidase P N-terminal domain-containing protein [Alistipes sp.]|nr:aminopeptidase P N-terminal domain-containing protein [Alistipes sp.]